MNSCYRKERIEGEREIEETWDLAHDLHYRREDDGDGDAHAMETRARCRRQEVGNSTSRPLVLPSAKH